VLPHGIIKNDSCLVAVVFRSLILVVLDLKLQAEMYECDSGYMCKRLKTLGFDVLLLLCAVLC